MRVLTINHRHSLFTHASRSTASSQCYDILVIFSTLKAKRQCRWRRLTLCGRFLLPCNRTFWKSTFYCAKHIYFCCILITSKRLADIKLKCKPMPNVIAALPNICGALCSTPQSLDDAHYYTVSQKRVPP